MKKIISLLLIACVAMLFTACKKEGVYTPSKKISRVYHTTPEGSKSLVASCTWNKDNTLDRIDYYSGGSISYSYNFTYEKKRVVKMSNYVDNKYYEYKYDGNKLKEIDYYRNGNLRRIYTFTYKGSTISEIEESYIDYKSADDRGPSGALDFIMPREFNQAYAKYQKQNPNPKATTEVTFYKLTWEKGNMVKAIVTEIEEGDNDEYVFEAKYDNKKNPMLGAALSEVQDIVNYRSKNNITESTERWDNGTEYYTVRYDYTYEGNYPKSFRKSWEEGGVGSSNIYTGYSGTTEYEYVK